MMMIRDWNRLPREVTDIPSLAAFKGRSRIRLWATRSNCSCLLQQVRLDGLERSIPTQAKCLLYGLWRKAETAGTDRPGEEEAQGGSYQCVEKPDEREWKRSSTCASRVYFFQVQGFTHPSVNFMSPPSFFISTASQGPSHWQCNSVVHQLLLPVLDQLQLAEGVLCPMMPLMERLNNTNPRY